MWLLRAPSSLPAAEAGLPLNRVLCCAQGAHCRSHLYLSILPLQVTRAILIEGKRNGHPEAAAPGDGAVSQEHQAALALGGSWLARV